MGTQGAGRKRSTNKDRTTAEDDALNLIAREAEARLAAKRAARAEAREIRMKELERQQKELSDDDERMSVGSRGSVRVEDGTYLEKGSRAASALTSTTLTSLGGTSSRRGSGETALTLDAEASIREIKDKLVEVEEKYRKAMVSNAQLDNEKNNLMYQVDTLKDSLMELEEQLTESRRECEDKVKEFEREKHAHTVLQFQFSELKETLKQSEELLNEIRQLRLKEEGFHREISDLQETVDWKDKKISALERQKEYTDAIRIERDELREEAVKLKDILKKHGIVLGPDLNVNGLLTETLNSEEPNADPASPSTQETPISPTEGNNSMLGNTEEESKDQRDETNPERSQDMHDGNEKGHLEDKGSESNDSKVDICGFEDQPIPKNEHLNTISSAEGADQVDTGTILEKKVVEPEPIAQKVDHQELKATQDIENIASQTSQDHLEEQGSSCKEVDSTQEIKIGAEQSDSAAKEGALTEEGLIDEPIVASSKVEDLETLDCDSEGVSSKSQATSAGGKKKKRKKRSKKKGKTSEDKNEPNQEKAIVEQDSRTGDGGAKDGLLKDSQSHNVTKKVQTILVDATKDDSRQMVEITGPVSKIENDSETKCLMDKTEKVEVKDAVAIVEANATCLETSDETAIDSTCTEELQCTDMTSSDNRQSLDSGGQEVQSESVMEVHDGNGTNVDGMDASENVVVLKAVENAYEDGKPSSDIATVSDKDGTVDEVVLQTRDNCGIESGEAFPASNTISLVGSSELNVQDNGIEESLLDRNEPEMVEGAGPVSKIENASETKCLMDNNEEVKDAVTIVEAVATCDETAVGSTCTEEFQCTDMTISDNRQSLDNGGQEVQSESVMEVHEGNGTNVDQMDASDDTENVIVLKDVEDGKPSSDIATMSEKDDGIDEVVLQTLDNCGIESGEACNTISQVGSSELNVQDKCIEERLLDRNEPEMVGEDDNSENKVLDIEETCDSVAESAILNNESPKLQNRGSTTEPIADETETIQAIDATVVEDIFECEKKFTEEDKDAEIMAIADDNEQKSSQSEQDEASSVVEVSSECSNDNKEVEAVEVGIDVLVQEDLSKEQSTDDLPQVSNQNEGHGNKELDVVDAGIESAAQIGSESVAEELDNCNIGNKEVGDVLDGREDQVEVGIDVVLEDDNSKDQSIKSEPQIISPNIENDLERGKPLGDIEVLAEDKSKDQADSSEAHVQNQVEKGHETLYKVEVKTESDGHSACQDVVHSMDQEAKPLVEIGAEVLIDDGYSEDQSINSGTNLQNQMENCTKEEDILDTGSQNELELVKDDTEVEDTPAEANVEIGVEDSAVEDDLKDQSIDCESPKGQNIQNDDKHSGDLGVEPHNSAQNDSNIDVELSGNSIEVEDDQCNTVGLASEEEEDEGEGLSFDFDDLELEAAIAQSSEFKPAEDEVELGVEVLAEEDRLKEDLSDKPQVETRDVDNPCEELDKENKVVECAAQNDDGESLDEASLAEQSETSQNQIGASSEHSQLVQDTLPGSSENELSPPKVHSKDSPSEKSSQDPSPNSGAARSGKEAKRSNKKGKGKGKDECKMT